MKAEQEYMSELAELAAKIKKPNRTVYIESAFHFKKYNVFKCVLNEMTGKYTRKQIVFNAPKWEALVIQSSQQTIADLQDGEMVLVRKYEVEEAIS